MKESKRESGRGERDREREGRVATVEEWRDKDTDGLEVGTLMEGED